MNGAAFDPAMLLELFDGDRTAVCELLAVAIDTIERDVLRVVGAVERNDAAGLASAAHSLKGASANIGCTSFSSLCASLEKDALAGHGASDRQALADLLSASDAVLQGIRSFRAG